MTECMVEDNIKNNIWTTGRARNMENKNQSEIEGGIAISRQVADIKKKRLDWIGLAWTCCKNGLRKDS